MRLSEVDNSDGSLYVNATLGMANGEEVSGRVLIEALDALHARLDDFGPPPLAA